MKKVAFKKDEKDEKDAKEKQEAMPKEKANKDKGYSSDSEEEVDSAEASEEVLDDVEASPEVTIAESIIESTSETLRSVASDWLGSVLKHNK